VDQPISSQYDQHPFNPDDTSNSGSKPDLGNTDSPELKVAWQTRPSFNTEPKDIDEGGSSPGAQDTGGDAQDFRVDFDSLGTQVASMLTRAGGLVTQYETLRSSVLGSEGTVFGQKSEFPAGTTNTYDSMSHTWSSSQHGASPTAFTKPAQDFAAQMNPIQEKGLQAIGAALELVGEYIALVNHSGQVYAATDRKSLFPPPPPNTVTG
jgi:hypothetical protein